ncbi:MAG: septation protein SpoVG family protein [Phycisphaerae bacterium]|nr:septation protein SpoVG family protein [Phycisphaerae bacterium]
MEITEVRVRLIPNRSNKDRLRAFCSVTLDGEFVIRDLKIIDGVNGIFVAMPSRKLADRCPRCRTKNHSRARFCNECGTKLNRDHVRKGADGRPKFHADVAHPINSQCRERIEAAVRAAYKDEQEKAQSPDYQPVAFDDDDFCETDYDDLIADLKRDAEKRRSRRDDETASRYPRFRDDNNVADEEQDTEADEDTDFDAETETESDTDDEADTETDADFSADIEPEPQPTKKPIELRTDGHSEPAPPPKRQREPEPEPDSEFGAGIL